MKSFFIHLFICVFFISCTNDKKPNIIWITIEDQSQYLLPFNGNTDVSLPNLEKIADESIIFNFENKNYFVTNKSFGEFESLEQFNNVISMSSQTFALNSEFALDIETF